MGRAWRPSKYAATNHVRGQQQRVAIARAVIAKPRLLLADEPTGNLDDDIGFRLMNLFEQLNRMGTTIVIATHSQQIMEKFAHPRMILQSGHLTIEHPRIGLTQKIQDKIQDVF